MVQTVLIGIAAGAASALLFASLASGSLLAISLFYLAPLPVMIAALGWGHVAGLIAAAAASIALGLLFGSALFITFVAGVALPAWWLGYLALLGRQAPAPGPDAIEWYPVGRLVLWAALLGAGLAIVLGALLVMATNSDVGVDGDSLQAAIRRALERLLRQQTETPADSPLLLPGAADGDAMLDFLATWIPRLAAIPPTINNVVNLWLAGRIVRLSGRLPRPWPELSAIRFPPQATMLLAAALTGSFLPGLPGLLAWILTACLVTAYALLGFAVVHATTHSLNGRGFILAGLYALVGVFGWPGLVIALVGIADTAIDIRGRVARRRPPPPA
jgi:hypothetical protein